MNILFLINMIILANALNSAQKEDALIQISKGIFYMEEDYIDEVQLNQSNEAGIADQIFDSLDYMVRYLNDGSETHYQQLPDLLTAFFNQYQSIFENMPDFQKFLKLYDYNSFQSTLGQMLSYIEQDPKCTRLFVQSVYYTWRQQQYYNVGLQIGQYLIKAKGGDDLVIQ